MEWLVKKGAKIEVEDKDGVSVTIHVVDGRWFNFLNSRHYTIVSRVSTHGCSQLKFQNLTMGGWTEEVLEWFNFTHLGSKVSFHGVVYQLALLLVLRWGKPDSRESIMLQSGSLVVNFCSVHHLQYASLVLQAKNAVKEAMDWVCVNLSCQISWCLKRIRTTTAM